MFNHSFLDPQLMGILGEGVVVLILVFDSIMSCSLGGGGVKYYRTHKVLLPSLLNFRMI